MKIERSALVIHSAEKMYQLVQDVPVYPQFLSWCTAAEVYEQTSAMQRASLTVAVAGIVQSFTTINKLHAGERVDMKLLDGPFIQLQGAWDFMQLGQAGCRISLKLDFEMRKSPVSLVFGAGFGRIADRLVDDFCRRADTVYI